MSRRRTVAVGILAVALTATVAAGTAVGVAHLTVLDPGFVGDVVEEEAGDELVEGAVAPATGVDRAGPGQAGLVDTRAVLQGAVTDAYVASQVDANVDRTYAYLHGNRADLNVSVATEPVVQNVSAATERQVRDASVADLLRTGDASLDGPVDAALVERLAANESSYHAARADFRERVRDRALDRAVDRTLRNRSDDELLALVVEDYDPEDYSEAEKERMVAEREPEIRAALRERIDRERGEEIDAAVADRIDRIRETGTANATAGTPTERAGAEVRSVVVRGLTTDASYESFRSDLDAAKADLAAATGDRVATQLDEEVPDRLSLVQTKSGDAPPAFQHARTGVTWLDRLALVLPAVALALVGLLYYVTGSVASVASKLGWSLVWTGLPTFVGVQLLRPRLDSVVARAGATEGHATDLIQGLVVQVLGVTWLVSLGVTMVGVSMLACVLAHRYGLFDRIGAELAERGIAF